ncbi:unnamed protein product [Parnassius apollo]|uniref:(apollo) hypothetical protein n=1 Tax=Parnassius apollo TaxID=110799 RepID=A0A8S3WXL3_PARAO|nr:unnamed protein product [Parnassius apollo]
MNSLERPIVSGTGPAPNQAGTVTFRRGLWSEPVNHSEGPWTEVVASKMPMVSSKARDLAGTEYIQRHDNVAKIVHQELAVKVKETEPY